MGRVNINGRAVRRLATKFSGEAARRGAERARQQTRANIINKGRIDTARMYRSVKLDLISSGTMTVYRLTIDTEYAAFQELGTRAHGPRTASVMVFTPKGSGTVVFAKWVRGVTPGHFARDAIRALTPADFANRSPFSG